MTTEHTKHRLYTMQVELLAMKGEAEAFEAVPKLHECVPLMQAAIDAIKAIDGSSASIEAAYLAVANLDHPMMDAFREARKLDRQDVLGWLDSV